MELVYLEKPWRSFSMKAVLSLCEWCALRVGRRGVTPYQEGNRFWGGGLKCQKLACAATDIVFITNERSGVPPLYITVMHPHMEPNSVQCRFLDWAAPNRSGHASLWIFDADSSAPRLRLVPASLPDLIVAAGSLLPDESLHLHARALCRHYLAHSLCSALGGSLYCTLSEHFAPFLHCQIWCAWLCAKVNTERTYLPNWKLQVEIGGWGGRVWRESGFVPQRSTQ